MHKNILFTLTLLITLAVASTSWGAFGAGIPTQAKSDFLAGVHLDADTYKCALGTQAAAVNWNTSAVSYGATGGAGSTSTITGEIINGTSGTAGYTAGGVTVARLATIVSGTKGVASFGTVTYSGLTTPTGGADCFIIYNSTKSNKIVYVGALASPLQCSNGTGTITMPTQDSTSGLIRFARLLFGDTLAVLRDPLSELMA